MTFPGKAAGARRKTPVAVGPSQCGICREGQVAAYGMDMAFNESDDANAPDEWQL